MMDPQIGAAAVLGVFTLCATWLGRSMSKRIGKPNGLGPMSTMLEHLIIGQARIEAKLEHHIELPAEYAHGSGSGRETRSPSDQPSPI